MDRYISYERLKIVADARKVLIAVLLCLLIVSVIVNIASLIIKERSINERIDMAVRNEYPVIIWERDTAILDYAALIDAVEHNCNESLLRRIYSDEEKIRQEEK